VHFHGYKVGKTRVTGCLEPGINSGVPDLSSHGNNNQTQLN